MESGEFHFERPMTRSRTANHPHQVEEEKRRRLNEVLEKRRGMVEATKEPGPNDIILERSLGQIKTEPNQDIVKQEIPDPVEPLQSPQAGAIKQEDQDSEEMAVEINEEIFISSTPPPDNLYEDFWADQDNAGSNIDGTITPPEYIPTNDEPMPKYLDLEFAKFREESQLEFALLKEQLAAKDLKIEEMERKFMQFQNVLENLGIGLESVRAEMASKNHITRNCGVQTNSVKDYRNLSESGLLGASDDEGRNDPVVSTALLNTGTFQDVPTRANDVTFVDTKVLLLFSEVLTVCWEKFAPHSENGWKCLNLQNCRLTCTAWKAGVDKLLASKNGPVPSIYCTTVEIQNNQRSVDLLNRWTNAYKEHREFPFLPRQVTFIDSENQQFPCDANIFDNCLGGKKLFLEAFGAHIRVFKYTMCFSEISRYGGLEEWYAMFSSWIWLMPNLEEIDLHDIDNPGTWELKSGNTREMNLYQRNPFPLLRNLKVFSMTGNGYSEHLVSSALSRNSSVENVSLNYIGSTFPEDIIPPDRLKHLDLCLSSSSDADWLCSLKQTGTLEILNIRINGLWSCDNNYLGRIRHFVEQCQVLTCLDLTLEASFCTGPVKLKKLAQLTIRVVGHTTHATNRVSFDERLLRMVKQMPSLNHMTIVGLPVKKISCMESVGVVSHGRLRKCVEEQLVIKLWEVVPSLNTVEIQLGEGRSFTFIRRKAASRNLTHNS